jgi:hypothetical protein
VYYGAYAGDVDDGANMLKQWFWQHKVARSLVANADEPWTELCWEYGALPSLAASPPPPSNQPWACDGTAALGFQQEFTLADSIGIPMPAIALKPVCA